MFYCVILLVLASLCLGSNQNRATQLQDSDREEIRFIPGTPSPENAIDKIESPQEPPYGGMKRFQTVDILEETCTQQEIPKPSCSIFCCFKPCVTASKKRDGEWLPIEHTVERQKKLNQFNLLGVPLTLSFGLITAGFGLAQYFLENEALHVSFLGSAMITGVLSALSMMMGGSALCFYCIGGNVQKNSENKRDLEELRHTQKRPNTGYETRSEEERNSPLLV